ncbi:glycosyltransferase [Methanobrevibacter sp.]
MDITLISRFFDARGTGIGIYSKLIYESLKSQDINLNKIGQDDSIIPSSYSFYFAFDLFRLLRKKAYRNSDVYHSLNPVEAIHVPKNKSVCTVHDLIPLTMKENIKQRIYLKIFYKGLMSALECEHITVVNPNLKDTLVSEYNAEESAITPIPPTIDDKYHPLNKSNDTYTIGTLSGLVPRKRIDILIKSFLKADMEDSRLLIGGVGMDEENLKRIANDDERIEFLGLVPDDKMNDFYNSLDVFVFPTLVEGYGMPIVEAMACGKPVVTLNDSDIPDVVKSRCDICSKENLHEVLSERKFSCNIKSNMEFSKDHSIENTGRKLMKIYESI